jgi:FG-GAP-like repeat
MTVASSIAAATTYGMLFFATLLTPGCMPQQAFAQPTVSASGWKKHAINDQSTFEACGAADFNGDGRIDVFSGDSWYENPTWQRHKVRDVAVSRNPHYNEDFCDSPLDVNGDGRPDIVSCNYFGGRVWWAENPGGDATGPWQEHEIDKPGNMETGVLVDLNGDGRPDFLPNVMNSVVWYELRVQSEVEWMRHEVGKEGAGHGVGTGDVNGDGRLDLLTPHGWYEQPGEPDLPWPFHAEFSLGAAGIQILGQDFDGDGLTDIVWGMGHDFGLYWLKQTINADGQRVWTKSLIDGNFSQAHTLMFAKLGKTEEPVLITGKRVYAHEVEPGDTQAPVVLSFHFDRHTNNWDQEVIFLGTPAANAPERAEDRWALKDFPRGSAGTGLQMAVADLDGDGDEDLICPGKTGLYWFENPRH